MARAKVYQVPPVRSPLEVGRWYPKPAFEKHYDVRRWAYVVRFTVGRHAVRCRSFSLVELLRQHATAYFQLTWNTQPYLGSQEVKVWSGKRQRWLPYPLRYPPGSTIRFRICYALPPRRDTEIIVYDGYGLPTRDLWWQQATVTTIALPPPLARAA